MADLLTPGLDRFDSIVFSVELSPSDPESGATVPVNLTTAPRLFDRAGLRAFRNRLLPPMKLTRRITGQGAIGGRSEVDAGELPIFIDGELEHLIALDWQGGDAVIKWAPEFQPDGSRTPYAAFQPAFTGYTIKPRTTGDSKLSIPLRGRAADLSDDMLTERYLGLGGKLVFTGSDGGPRGFIEHSDRLSFAGDFTVAMRLSLDEEPLAGAEHVVIVKGVSNPDTNYRMGYLSDGRVRFVSADTVLDSEPDVFEVGQPIWIVATHSKDKIEIFAGTSAETLRSVGLATASQPITNSGRVHLARHGTDRYRCSFHWLGFYAAAMTLEEAREAISQPIISPGDVEHLTAEYGFLEGIGATVYNSVDPSIDELSLTGTPLPTWEASDTGDHPAQFDGSPAGSHIPRIVGRVRSAPLVHVDTQRKDWQPCSKITDFTALFDNRVPLFPDESVTAAAGEVSFDKAAGRMALTPASGLSFKRFVPGQTDPARTGQQVTITGPLNAGTWTINAEGISEDGLTMTLVEVMTDAGTPTESTLITATAPDFSYDLSVPRFRLEQFPAGVLSMDGLGELRGGDDRLSDIFELVTGAAPDISALEWNPRLGVVISEPVPRLEFLDACVQSALAYWVERPSGGYSLASYRPPAATWTKSFSDATSIKSLRELNSAQGAWRIEALYDRTWQTIEAPSGSVTPGDARAVRLTFPYSRSRPLRVRRRLEDELTFETYLTGSADADVFLRRAAALYGVPYRFFELELVGQPFGAITNGETIGIRHSDPTYRLPVHQGLVVTGHRDELLTDKTHVEGYLR